MTPTPEQYRAVIDKRIIAAQRGYCDSFRLQYGLPPIQDGPFYAWLKDSPEVAMAIKGALMCADVVDCGSADVSDTSASLKREVSATREDAASAALLSTEAVTEALNTPIFWQSQGNVVIPNSEHFKTIYLAAKAYRARLSHVTSVPDAQEECIAELTNPDNNSGHGQCKSGGVTTQPDKPMCAEEFHNDIGAEFVNRYFMGFNDEPVDKFHGRILNKIKARDEQRDALTRQQVVDECAAIVDRLNQEGPYAAIGAAPQPTTPTQGESK
jgi:hypothetical protein